MIPVNQSYRVGATHKARPDVVEREAKFREWARHSGVAPGRAYDVALAWAAWQQHFGTERPPFVDQSVCELGARCSFFSPYITGCTHRTCVSDSFEKWDYLGGFIKWRQRWEAAAEFEGKLVCDYQDAMHTTYRDDVFDVVVAFSVIEHVPDPEAMVREMARVCKPGGLVLLSTDQTESPRRGFFTEAELWSRLIKPSGCAPIDGPAYDWAGADKKRHRDGFAFTCTFLALEKPT